MLNNITMGQYYPTDSAVHRLDPRTKILLTVFFIVGVFMIHSLWGYALALAFVYFMARMSRVPFKMLMKGLKPLRVILILTFLLNLFFSGEGTPLVHWGFLLITQEGLSRAVHYCLRCAPSRRRAASATVPGGSPTTRRRFWSPSRPAFPPGITTTPT